MAAKIIAYYTSVILLFYWWIDTYANSAALVIIHFEMQYHCAEYYTHEWCLIPHRNNVLKATIKLSCSETDQFVDVTNISYSLSLNYNDWCIYNSTEKCITNLENLSEPEDCTTKTGLKHCRTTCKRPKELCEQTQENLDMYRQDCKAKNECTITIEPKNLFNYCKDDVKYYDKTDDTLYWSKWATLNYRCLSNAGKTCYFQI